jgi:hypothetical protein
MAGNLQVSQKAQFSMSAAFFPAIARALPGQLDLQPG